MGFAESLQALRKEAKVTQEQLASHLGVSAQAVSKWENGSYPEGDLLPRIADYFNVSIDYLYGRETSRATIEQRIVNYLSQIMRDARDKGDFRKGWETYKEVLEQCLWALQLSAWPESKHYYERPVSDPETQTASSIQHPFGASYYSLTKGREFYIFLPQPEDDKGFERWFRDTGKTRELFRFLSERENLSVVCFLYSLKPGEFATRETVAKQTGLPAEKVAKTLDELFSFWKNRKAVYDIGILDPDGSKKVAAGVDMSLAPLLIGMFALADSYINTPEGFNVQISSREESFLDRGKLKDCKY